MTDQDVTSNRREKHAKIQVFIFVSAKKMLFFLDSKKSHSSGSITWGDEQTGTTPLIRFSFISWLLPSFVLSFFSYAAAAINNDGSNGGSWGCRFFRGRAIAANALRIKRK